MKLATVDLNLLKATDALLRELSVTRAADRTGVSQQAMSGQLRRVRELFGDEILVQRGRTMVPTPLGGALIQPVREALMQVERALVIRPEFDSSLSRRSFVIATLSYVGSTLIPHLVARMSTISPSTSVKLRPIDVRFHSDLTERRVEVCLVNAVWRVNQGLLPPGVNHTHLYDDDFVCVCDASQLSGSQMSLDHYLKARHVVVDLGSGGFTSVEKAWLRHGFNPCVPLHLQSFTDIFFAVPGTDLVATVHRRLADRWAKAFGLSIFEAPFEIDPVRIEMLWHAQDELDPALSFLRQELIAAAMSL